MNEMSSKLQKSVDESTKLRTLEADYGKLKEVDEEQVSYGTL
jgi:hypothetical protein